MGADQTAAIRPALRELFDAIANDEPDAKNLCATLSIPEQPDAWVQVLHGTINAAYPHSEEPLSYLRSANVPTLPALAIENWEPGRYATFTHNQCPVDSVAEFIDRTLVALHALPADDYDIDVAFQHVA